MTLEEAEALDAADPLAAFRDRFRLPPGLIYLDGNSLGPPPRDTGDALDRLVRHDWAEGLVRSWNVAGWADAPVRVGASIAAIIGAEPDEVIVADSTSVCLFKLLVAAAGLRDGAIVAEQDGFPTDAYVAERAAALLGRPFRPTSSASLPAAFRPDVAAAILAHVDYRTAARLDMGQVTARAHANQTRIIWDLSHSAGVVPLDLRRDGVELAVGCGYKYLNGGPGAPAFLYVARTLQARLDVPIAGWWAHSAPFDFAPEFTPAAGVSRFLSGTPPILGLAALECGVRAQCDADPAAMWAKAVRLWDLFVGEVERRCPTLSLRSPRDPNARGAHVAFAHPQAQRIVRALAAEDVIGDFRGPDIARFGFAPLYLRHADVWRAAHRLADIVEQGRWADPRFAEGGLVP